MTTIRHVCVGHEYRYNVEIGIVTNNYGTDVALLRICKFTGTPLLYHAMHRPEIYIADFIASGKVGMSDVDLAQFAIGQYALYAGDDNV